MFEYYFDLIYDEIAIAIENYDYDYSERKKSENEKPIEF